MKNEPLSNITTKCPNCEKVYLSHSMPAQIFRTDEGKVYTFECECGAKLRVDYVVQLTLVEDALIPNPAVRIDEISLAIGIDAMAEKLKDVK